MTEPVDLTSVVDLVARRQQLKVEVAAREADIKVLDERIKAAWGDADEAFVVVAGERQPIGTWKEVESSVLDQRELKAAYPDVVKACTVRRTTRTFRLTWEPPTPEPKAESALTVEARYSEWED